MAAKKRLSKTKPKKRWQFSSLGGHKIGGGLLSYTLLENSIVNEENLEETVSYLEGQLKVLQKSSSFCKATVSFYSNEVGDKVYVVFDKEFGLPSYFLTLRYLGEKTDEEMEKYWENMPVAAADLPENSEDSPDSFVDEKSLQKYAPFNS